MQVPLAIGKRKIDVQNTSINLKVIQKEKIKQNELLRCLWISIYVKTIYITKCIPPYIKLTDELRIALQIVDQNTGQVVNPWHQTPKGHSVTKPDASLQITSANPIQGSSMTTRSNWYPWRKFEGRNIPVNCVIWDMPLNKHQVPETCIC